MTKKVIMAPKYQILVLLIGFSSYSSKTRSVLVLPPSRKLALEMRKGVKVHSVITLLTSINSLIKLQGKYLAIVNILIGYFTV